MGAPRTPRKNSTPRRRRAPPRNDRGQEGPETGDFRFFSPGGAPDAWNFRPLAPRAVPWSAAQEGAKDRGFSLSAPDMSQAR
jgi:hypothetical protein